MLGFRRRVDVIKAFKGARPSQPESNGEDEQEQTKDERQADRMRRFGIQDGAVDNAEAGAEDKQRHAGPADHRQTIMRQLARLVLLLVRFVCHSNTAFANDTLLRWRYFAFERRFSQVKGGAMSAIRVLFIRHGQTDFNIEHRLQGALPVPLNERGRAQSRALAHYLKTVPIDAIYASPRSRALETAQIIGAALGQEARQDERLAEIAFGDFEGHTFAEVEARYPTAYRKWESGYRPYRVPGGESRLDVQRRMQSAWDDITGTANLRAVGIVGHSSAMMILLASMFARLPDKAMKNTSITTLDRFEDTWQISAFAELPHERR